MDTQEPESFAEKLDRIQAMADDDGDTWDLSQNDKAALIEVLAYIERLKQALVYYGEHKRGCASRWRASTGSSQIGPCDCGLIAAVTDGQAPARHLMWTV